jgi:bifunctional non-homologous end joining protein LigD
VFELKYDGFRMLAAKDGDDVTLRYRSGRDVTGQYTEIVAAVARLPCRRALLDGELVVCGPTGRPDFGALQRRAFRTSRGRFGAQLCVFDLLALDEDALRPLPLLRRKELLRELLRASNPALLYVEHLAADGEELLRGARELGLEGVVAKRADAPYVAGRNSGWRKFKLEDTSDFVVIGIAPPARATFDRPGTPPGARRGRRAGVCGPCRGRGRRAGRAAVVGDRSAPGPTRVRCPGAG